MLNLSKKTRVSHGGQSFFEKFYKCLYKSFISHHSVVILKNEHVKSVKKTAVSHGGQQFFAIFLNAYFILFKSHHSVVILKNERVKCVKKKRPYLPRDSHKMLFFQFYKKKMVKIKIYKHASGHNDQHFSKITIHNLLDFCVYEQGREGGGGTVFYILRENVFRY